MALVFMDSLHSIKRPQGSKVKIENVLTYINEHIDQPLLATDLADVACFSVFHFQRAFILYTGYNVAEYVLLTRLRKAIYELQYRPSMSVLDIALSCGFSHHQSFTRAFKRQFHQAPSVFRKQFVEYVRKSHAIPTHQAIVGVPANVSYFEELTPTTHSSCIKMLTVNENNGKHANNKEVNIRGAYMTDISSKNIPLQQIQVIDFPRTAIAFLTHEGDPEAVMKTVAQFIQWRKQYGPSPRTSKTYNILYNDPRDVPKEEYRFDVAASIRKVVEPNDYAVQQGVIGSGRCARFRHNGSDRLLSESIDELYKTISLNEDYEIRNAPLFVERVQGFPDVPENDTIIDIYLPIV